LRNCNEGGPKAIYEEGLAKRGDLIVKQRSSIDPDMVVDEIMTKWPTTVAVVLRYKMLCVGCPIGTFHTVAEACREHRIDEGDFLVELEAAVRGKR
jgi:hybrid cluster-associated redox disulfide protein